MTINGHPAYFGEHFLNARNHQRFIHRLHEMLFMSHRGRRSPLVPASRGDVMRPISTRTHLSIHDRLGEATSSDHSRSLS